jgi:hypothetical protein
LSQNIVLESIEEVMVQLSWYEVELVAMKGPGHNPHFGHSQRNDDERGSSIDNTCYDTTDRIARLELVR